MVTFKPIEQPVKSIDVPFFEDARKSDGWEGYSTNKSITTLKSEIIAALSRLGGNVTKFEEGDYDDNGRLRTGFRIHYVIKIARKNGWMED